MSEEILKKLQEHDERFDAHDERFDKIDQVLDFLARKSVEHDDRIQRVEENMATKADIREISNTLDTLVKFSIKKDQELTMVTHGMRRHEDRIEHAESDIKKMKPLLGLAS